MTSPLQSESRKLPVADAIDEELEDEDEDASYEDDNETEVLNDNTPHWVSPLSFLPPF